MRHASKDEPVIVVKWMEFLKWLLPVTEKFPKRVRYSLANRIDNLALDMVEDLVEAQYTRNKQAILKRSNLRLEKLRVLVRISCDQRHLSHQTYEYANSMIAHIAHANTYQMRKALFWG
jgi:hypothetical protein